MCTKDCGLADTDRLEGEGAIVSVSFPFAVIKYSGKATQKRKDLFRVTVLLSFFPPLLQFTHTVPGMVQHTVWGLPITRNTIKIILQGLPSLPGILGYVKLTINTVIPIINTWFS